ncbi:MAG: RICIN domain-containing protein [Ruminococcus sp.]
MKHRLRKLTSILISIVMIFGVLTVAPFTVSAATGNDLVRVAQGEVGASGRPNKYTYYIGSIGGTYAYAWCHAFVSWCANQAGVGDLIPKTASCSTGVSWFENRNQFQLRSSGYVPKAGDIVYFGSGGGSHVGIVTSSNGSRVYTIEGNAKDTVKVNGGYSNGYSISDTYIYGYGCPAYSNNPTGVLDSVSGGTGTVSIGGWAFDRDDLSAQLIIDVYIGGPSGDSNAEGHYNIIANVERTDVNAAYGCGNYHGFNATINTSKTGTQPVYVYAINVGGGINVCIGSGTVNITVAQGREMAESEAAGRTIPDGDYWICSEVAQKFFVDIPGNEAITKPGVNAQMWIWKTSMPTEYDVFHIEYLNNGFYKIQQYNSNYCLDVEGYGFDIGTNVQMWTENGCHAQQWSIESTEHGYAIRSRCNNYYLDVSDGGVYKNGQNLIVWEGNGNNNQHFSFIPYSPNERPINNGEYRIASKVSETCYLDVDNFPGNFTNGSNVQIVNSPDESFSIEYVGDGYYRIYETTSKLCVEIVNDDTYLKNKKNAMLYETTDSRGQLWKIIKNTDGSFFLVNKLSGYYLDVYNGKTENLTNVQAHIYNGSNAQKWYFKRILTEEMVTVEGWEKKAGVYRPNVKVVVDEITLEENKDFTVSEFVENDILYAKITGIGNYCDSVLISYEIPQNYIGDVNNDNAINISDTTEIQKYIASINTLDENALIRADVNSDGNVSIKDATLIQQYCAGLIEKF